MKGPAISVKCDCGETRSVAYGERWECETCGRRWNTDQIPPDEYRQLARVVRRHQLEAVGFVAVMAAIFAPLVVLVDFRFAITGLIVFFAWAFLLRPWQRRRLLDVVRREPWRLRPE